MRINPPPFSQEELRRLMAYDPDTGDCFWVTKLECNSYDNGPVGTFKDKKGMLAKIHGREYGMMRLMFYHVTGEWVKGTVTPRDGNPLNLKFENFVVRRIGE